MCTNSITSSRLSVIQTQTLIASSFSDMLPNSNTAPAVMITTAARPAPKVTLGNPNVILGCLCDRLDHDAALAFQATRDHTPTCVYEVPRTSKPVCPQLYDCSCVSSH